MRTFARNLGRAAPSALVALLVAGCLIGLPVAAAASQRRAGPTRPAAAVPIIAAAPVLAAASGGGSLEGAAERAGQLGRKVAMSLIGLGLAIAAVVLAFRRDFREATGVFAIGLVAVLLATPAGESLLRDTVNSLFGS